MRHIQHILLSGILVLSASSAMAAAETQGKAMTGFHAMSQVTDSRDQTKLALTDEQLDTITGGWTLLGSFRATGTTGVQLPIPLEDIMISSTSKGQGQLWEATGGMHTDSWTQHQ